MRVVLVHVQVQVQVHYEYHHPDLDRIFYTSEQPRQDSQSSWSLDCCGAGDSYISYVQVHVQANDHHKIACHRVSSHVISQKQAKKKKKFQTRAKNNNNINNIKAQRKSDKYCK